MRVQIVECHIRKYLIDKDWKIKKPQKRKRKHGVDIHAWHPKWRKFSHQTVSNIICGEYHG